MTWAYRIFFPLLLIPALPYYFWRMLRRGGYGAGFSQRFGFFPEIGAKCPGKRRFWIQAVSVGEIEAIGPLLRQLHATGEAEIILTTTTSTGYRLAQERYGEVARQIGIFPADLWPCCTLAWRRIRPDVVVLVEGELWPEHLAQARARGIPAYLINGRLSDRSFARHQRFPRFSAHVLGHFQAIAAGSEEDVRRYRVLGCTAHLTGNIKFDVASEAPMSGAERTHLRTELGFGADPRTVVLLGSSTWKGEEALLLKVTRELRAAGHDVRLLLVPRHSERRAELATETSASGLAWHQRSTGGAVAPAETIVHVADTTGELRRLTRAADLAFCGKSLEPHEGGQTPIEAAAAGVALTYGPRMTNFRDICRGLEQAQASVRARDAAELIAILSRLVPDAAAREKMGQRGAAWHQGNRGATERTLSLLQVNQSAR
jgi:3-deoxy-D-manno-octulosonic-acid transferase